VPNATRGCADSRGIERAERIMIKIVKNSILNNPKLNYKKNITNGKYRKTMLVEHSKIIQVNKDKSLTSACNYFANVRFQ